MPRAENRRHPETDPLLPAVWPPRLPRVINGLMAEVLEEHVREYLLPPDSEAGSREVDAAEELIEIIHSYLT